MYRGTYGIDIAHAWTADESDDHDRINPGPIVVGGDVRMFPQRLHVGLPQAYMCTCYAGTNGSPWSHATRCHNAGMRFVWLVSFLSVIHSFAWPSPPFRPMTCWYERFVPKRYDEKLTDDGASSRTCDSLHRFLPDYM